jgi:hypothetical protein
MSIVTDYDVPLIPKYTKHMGFEVLTWMTDVTVFWVVLSSLVDKYCFHQNVGTTVPNYTVFHLKRS